MRNRRWCFLANVLCRRVTEFVPDLKRLADITKHCVMIYKAMVFELQKMCCNYYNSFKSVNIGQKFLIVLSTRSKLKGVDTQNRGSEQCLTVFFKLVLAHEYETFDSKPYREN